MRTSLHDMHCHLDFMSNGEEVAAAAAAAGMLLFANTVTPEGWATARERFAPYGNVRVGFGMHPWWVAEPEERPAADCAERRAAGQPAADCAERRAGGQSAADCAEPHIGRGRLAPERLEQVLALLGEHDPSFVGEVGLDFSRRHVGSRDGQLAMLAAIARWAAERGGKLLSLHSVKAARETLDVLERAGALASCTCIFHWFSGPSDQLKRAIDDGCYFSCGPRMLATKRGREYVKAIPAARLLLETDAPPEPGMAYPFDTLCGELERAADGISAVKGPDALNAIEHNARFLTHHSK